MTIKLDTDLRNYIVDQGVVGAIGSAEFKIYSGAQPANADTAASGTLLCTITLQGFGSAAAGAAVASSLPIAGTANATGTAGWARIITGSYALDGTVATSGGDFTINTLSLVSGGAVSLTACTLTMPAS